MSKTDAAALQNALSPGARAVVASIDVFSEIESTNTYLLDLPDPEGGTAQVALADHQTAGRGRQDKRWHSPSGSGLYLSLAYSFVRYVRNPASLTLAVGVAVVDALANLGIHGPHLKWPNDVILNDGKLGGILTELKSAGAGGVTVVIGIGINIDYRDESDDIEAAIGRVADLGEVVDSVPDKGALAAAIINSLAPALRLYEEQGIKAFVERWRSVDWLLQRQVRIELPDRTLSGVADGIDDDGALLLATASGRERIISGSVIPVAASGSVNKA